ACVVASTCAAMARPRRTRGACGGGSWSSASGNRRTRRCVARSVLGELFDHLVDALGRDALDERRHRVLALELLVLVLPAPSAEVLEARVEHAERYDL